MQKGLIGIAASERNNFSWDFINSLLNLKSRSGCGVGYSQIGSIDIARNQILLLGLKHECDYICMVDSDMTFPSDGIEKLLETMKKFGADIGTGLYFKGNEPHDPVAMDYKDGIYVPISEWDKPRLVDACGMGFTIIKKDLFGIRFAFTQHNKKILGEDVTFCHLARDMGAKIVLDPSIKLGHLRLIEVNEQYIKNKSKE